MSLNELKTSLVEKNREAARKHLFEMKTSLAQTSPIRGKSIEELKLMFSETKKVK